MYQISCGSSKDNGIISTDSSHEVRITSSLSPSCAMLSPSPLSGLDVVGSSPMLSGFVVSISRDHSHATRTL